MLYINDKFCSMVWMLNVIFRSCAFHKFVYFLIYIDRFWLSFWHRWGSNSRPTRAEEMKKCCWTQKKSGLTSHDLLLILESSNSRSYYDEISRIVVNFTNILWTAFFDYILFYQKIQWQTAIREYIHKTLLYKKTLVKCCWKWLQPSISSTNYAHKSFIQKLFWQLFSSYMYVEKAAKATSVQKNLPVERWWKWLLEDLLRRISIFTV